MFSYSFSANNNIELLFVDDDGAPFNSKKISFDDVKNETLRENLKNPNVLIISKPVPMEQINALDINSKLKNDLVIFFNQSVSEKFDQFKTEEDWEKFFNENEIGYELSKTEEKYLYH